MYLTQIHQPNAITPTKRRDSCHTHTKVDINISHFPPQLSACNPLVNRNPISIHSKNQRKQMRNGFLLTVVIINHKRTLLITQNPLKSTTFTIIKNPCTHPTNSIQHRTVMTNITTTHIGHQTCRMASRTTPIIRDLR